MAPSLLLLALFPDRDLGFWLGVFILAGDPLTPEGNSARSRPELSAGYRCWVQDGSERETAQARPA